MIPGSKISLGASKINFFEHFFLQRILSPNDAHPLLPFFSEFGDPLGGVLLVKKTIKHRFLAPRLRQGLIFGRFLASGQIPQKCKKWLKR